MNSVQVSVFSFQQEELVHWTPREHHRQLNTELSRPATEISMYQSFEDLEVWKRACQLAVRVYGCVSECRDFSLRDQMQRAAVSIASNVAEGSERGGKDFARFLAIARGSAAELRTQLYIAARIGIIDDRTMQELVGETKQIAKMAFALARSLRTGR